MGTQARLSVPTDKGTNAGAKVVVLVAGTLAGADSIDHTNAPSRLDGSIAGPDVSTVHVEIRQLAAVAIPRSGELIAGALPLQFIGGSRRIDRETDKSINGIISNHPSSRLEEVSPPPSPGTNTDLLRQNRHRSLAAPYREPCPETSHLWLKNGTRVRPIQLSQVSSRLPDAVLATGAATRRSSGCCNWHRLSIGGE